MKQKEKKEIKKKTKKNVISSESDSVESEFTFFSESESEHDSEEPTRKQPSRTAKKMKEERAAILEAGLPSTEANYDSSETMPEVNLGSENNLVFQTQTNQSSINKPTDSMLGVEEESVNGPAQQKMIIVRMETHSQLEPLEIAPLQVCIPPSQTTEASPIKLNHPPQSLQVRKSAKKQPRVSYMSTRSNSPPEATAALMMIANTASYIPKQFLVPSFSLGFTDLTQEETLSQEGRPGFEKGKSPETPILIEELEELVEEIANSGVKSALNFAEGKHLPVQK
ncbi:hypothetical protein AHAS_Ahas19G0169600 [Arachis hypogaea]